MVLNRSLNDQQRTQYQSLLKHDQESAERYLKLVNGESYWEKADKIEKSVEKNNVTEINFKNADKAVDQVGDALDELKDLRMSGRATRMRERKILVWLKTSECHKKDGYIYPSFQQFLDAKFSVTEARVYKKELTVAAREVILGLPIGTYSQWEFLPLQRFKVIATIGQLKGDGTKWESGTAAYGTKIDSEQVIRLKECWAIAKELANSTRPKREHILAAAKQLSQKYRIKVQDRKSITYWKNRAIAAEAKLAELLEN